MNGDHLTDDEFRGYVRARLEDIVRGQEKNEKAIAQMDGRMDKLSDAISEMKGCARAWGAVSGIIAAALAEVGVTWMRK